MSGSNPQLIDPNPDETPQRLFRSRVPTPVPQAHIFCLQDALNAFGASGHAVLVSEPTTMSPSAALFMAMGSADNDLPEKLSDLLDKTSAVPSTTSLTIVSEPELTPTDLEAISHLEALLTYVNVSAKTSLLRLYPDLPTWDVVTNADSARKYTQANTNALFQVITTSLSGFLVNDSMVTQEFNRNVQFDDLHSEFLNDIFGSFGLPDASKAELDGVLTTTTKSLVKMTSAGEATFSSLDFMIFVTYFEKMQGIDYNIPKMRLFYLHIDQKSWMDVVSHGKNSPDTQTARINFAMNYVDA